MKRGHTLLLSGLAAILVLPVAFYLAWVRPGQSRILIKGISPDGREYCVVQSYQDMFEPYRVSFYVRGPDRIWHWNYLAHQDESWSSARVVFRTNQAVVFCNGVEFRTIDLPNDSVDIATVLPGYRDDYCPKEYTVEDVFAFHCAK